jgi:hypothetical protein
MARSGGRSRLRLGEGFPYAGPCPDAPPAMAGIRKPSPTRLLPTVCRNDWYLALLRRPETGQGWPLAEARAVVISPIYEFTVYRFEIFQIATTRRVMIGTGGILLLNHRLSLSIPAIWKTLPTGARSGGSFLLVGQLIGPGEANATPAHPRDLIALAIAQIPCPVCLVGLRRAWLRIRCRTVTLSSLNVRAHRFLERHASLRLDEVAI